MSTTVSSSSANIYIPDLHTVIRHRGETKSGAGWINAALVWKEENEILVLGYVDSKFVIHGSILEIDTECIELLSNGFMYLPCCGLYISKEERYTSHAAFLYGTNDSNIAEKCMMFYSIKKVVL